MSDTNGATDLQPDMPGIGATPGIARGAPSPLQGLAQAYQSIFGPRPAPRPAPTPQLAPPQPQPPGPGGSAARFDGTSMYEYPRASPAQVQRPRPQPWNQPPQPTRQSPPDTPPLSPTGLPPPVRRFSPYVPALPNREPNAWGLPPFAPRMPMGFEVPGIYQGVGQFFSQRGTAITALLGAGLGKNAGDFIKSYQQGMEWQSKMRREQMQDRALELEEKSKEENDAYAEVFDTYAANDYKPVGGVPIEQALGDIAARYGDRDMDALLGGGEGGVAKAFKLIQNRDSHWQDLHAANKQSAKESEKEAEDAETKSEWGDTSSGDQTGTEPTAGGAPARPFGPPAGGPPPGVLPPPKAAQPGQPRDASDTPTHDAGMQIFEGANPDQFPPAIRGDAELVASNAHRDMSRILDGVSKGTIRPGEVQGMVNKIDPTLGRTLDGVIHYRIGRGSSGGGSGGKPEFWDMIESAAAAANPNWSQSTYKAVMDFRDKSQQQNSPIQRIPTSVAAGRQVIDDLNAIQKRDGTAADTSLASIKGKLGLDPLYAALYGDWLNYNQDIQVLTTSPSVTETKMSEETVPWYGSASAYRAVVKQHMGVAESRKDQLHNQWDSYKTGDPMPGVNPQAEEDMDKIRRLDPESGKLPGETLTTKSGKVFLYTGKNPRDPGADENWVPQ